MVEQNVSLYLARGLPWVPIALTFPDSITDCSSEGWEERLWWTHSHKHILSTARKNPKTICTGKRFWLNICLQTLILVFKCWIQVVRYSHLGIASTKSPCYLAQLDKYLLVCPIGKSESEAEERALQPKSPHAISNTCANIGGVAKHPGALSITIKASAIEYT